MFLFFFFNDTATTEIYTLSLHDALPISRGRGVVHKNTNIRNPHLPDDADLLLLQPLLELLEQDRKSTRLNSSHLVISYAVFCLKKKKNIKADCTRTDLSTPNTTHERIVS